MASKPTNFKFVKKIMSYVHIRFTFIALYFDVYLLIFIHLDIDAKGLHSPLQY